MMISKVQGLGIQINKPGSAQVGAISKAQKTKRTSKCQSIGELGTLLWIFFRKKSHNAEKN